MAKGTWTKMTLGDVVELKRGYDLPERDREDGPYPIVSSSGISGRHSKAMVKAPGVVTGRYGTLGVFHYITEDYWPLNTALYVRDFKGNHPRFISYFLRTLDFFAYSDKAAVPGLNRNHLHMAPVTIPDPDTQRAIAGVLGALDDKIEVNRGIARTLEAAARALFESWFVRFEHPATTAAAPRTSDSPLGPNSKVPDGWKVMTPWEAFEVNPTRTLSRDSDAAYLDMSNMPTQGHAPESWVRRAVGSGMKFMNGDTLVARITPCLENGKTAFVDFLEDGEVGWGSTEYIVMRPKKPLPLVFAYCLARSDEFRTFAIRQMSGSSGRQRVPAESLRQFFLAVPPAPIAEEFGRVVEPIFGRIKTAMEQTRALSAMRDALLPKLISGELPVPEALGRGD